MLRSLISWLTAAGMVFAVVAVAVPCATAGRFGPGQPGATTTVEPRPPRALCHQYCGTVRHGPPAGGLSNLKPSPAPQVETVARDGFDWTDAGIGAAAAIGLGLAALGALALARRRRLRRTAISAPFGAALAVALAALASTGVAAPASGRPTQLQLQRCERLVKGAPWTQAVRGSIGPVRGSRYAVWIGSWGPPCALAKSKTARLSGVRTPRRFDAPR
jgi:hypothetical protein